MKKTLFCILRLLLCISMLGIIPAAMAENATVRVGELIWIQEDENQRSASIARILSEISRRIGKNIEFVSVDSGARLLALNSGKVDVIFWARNHTQHDTVVDTAAWKAVLRDHPDLENNLTAEEEDRIRKVRDAILSIRSDENEQMEGTILSKPFYSDWYAYLVRKE